LAATASGTAYADASANIGIMSDYIFRGVYTSDASAFAGLDIEAESGVYLGVWGADIQNGLEYDVYLGYAGGGENITWNVGLTGYYYTDATKEYLSPFDIGSSAEWNFGFSYGFLTIDVALGDYNNQSTNGEEQTYTYVGATFAPEVGPYYFIGKNTYKEVRGFPGSGARGYWVEIGKAFEIGDDLELSIAALYTPDAANPTDSDPFADRAVFLSGTNPFAEFAAVATLTKTIALGN
jgi:hypothetical protein